MNALSARECAILSAVVTEFIESGEPVGSRTIAKKYGLDLSPASIRNAMADLEDGGYLYQPHTSAGRLPTDQAFRVFVDKLMTVRGLSGDEEAEIQALDHLTPGMTLLRQSGRVLSKLTGAASVVVVPRVDRRLRELHFIITSDSSRTLLAVLLFSDGTVESRYVEVDELPDDAELTRIHNLLEEVVKDRTLQQVRDSFAQAMAHERNVLDSLVRRAYQLGYLATEQPLDTEPVVVIEGRSRLIEDPDFEDVDRLRHLMRTLDERERLLLLLDRTILARTVQVLLGHDTDLLGDTALSLVAAPFMEAGRSIGTIGVLGPTRMNYPRVVPLVSATATAVSAAHDREAGVQVVDEPSSAGPKRKRKRTR